MTLMGTPAAKPMWNFKPAHTISTWDFTPPLDVPQEWRQEAQARNSRPSTSAVQKSASLPLLALSTSLEAPPRTLKATSNRPASTPASTRPTSKSQLDALLHGRYNNPFITRFQERRHDGGFYQ